jgi:hypothetical protein
LIYIVYIALRKNEAGGFFSQERPPGYADEAAAIISRHAAPGGKSKVLHTFCG